MRYNPQKNRRSSNRTRFDVATAERAQRAVVRVPVIKPALVAVLALAILAMLGVAWYNGPAWRVSEISVTNNEGIPMEQIIGASGLQNEHYQFVNLTEAAQRIDDLPGVDAAQVTCMWRWTATTCQIAVQPAQPLAIWTSTRGNVWTDFEGKVQRAPDQLAARLSIRVEDGEAPLIGVPLDAPMLTALTDLSTVQPAVRKLLYSQEFGLMYDDERGARIRLGAGLHEGEILDKMRMAQILTTQLTQQGVQARIIDVRHPAAPYYIK